MAFVPVPKDLSKLKNKVAFNLTKRQILCFAGAAAVGIPFYLLARTSLGTDITVLLMMALMLPFFALGMFERDGQPLEKLLRNFVCARYLYPRVRPYQTDNFYAALERQSKFDKEVISLETKNKASGTAAKKAPAAHAVKNRRG